MATIGEGTLLAGRYRLQERLGQGGMATVYRAHDTRLDRPVAVKILTGHDRHAATLAAREAHLAARVAHPHIVEVYDRGHTPDARPFLVLRLIVGPPSAGALPMPPARAVTLGIEVAAALAHAHAHGIVHGDVTPQNILLDPARGAQLTDFGVASTIAATPGAPIYGAAAYVAPERLRGAPPTPATDIYALGATLYHLLAALPPYAGDSGAATAAQVLAGPPVPLRVLAPALPPAVVAVIDRALARDPADRYPSAEALRSALVAARRTGPAPLRAARALLANFAAVRHAFARTVGGHPTADRPPDRARRAFRDGAGVLRGRTRQAVARVPRRSALVGLTLLLLLVAALALAASRLPGRSAPVAAQDKSVSGTVVAATHVGVPASPSRAATAITVAPAPLSPTAAPASAAPLPPLQVEAAISDPRPPRSARMTVTGRLWRGDTGIAGVPLRSVWHFRSGDATCRGLPTGPDGRATCTLNMSGATADYPVTVDVFFEHDGQTYQAQVTFIPR